MINSKLIFQVSNVHSVVEVKKQKILIGTNSTSKTSFPNTISQNSLVSLDALVSFLLKSAIVIIPRHYLISQLCEGGSVGDLVRGLSAIDKKMREEHIAYILKEVIKVSTNV